MNPWQHLMDKHAKALEAAHGIFTWTAADELAWLAEEASKRADILEIGTYKGHSAKVLARAVGEKGHVTCWDRCPDDGVEAAARRNLAGEVNVTLVHGDAGVSAVRHCMAGGKHFDMVWIDDGHTYGDVVRDCLIAMALVRRLRVPGSAESLICGHDYERPFNPVARAVNDCFGERNVKRGPGSVWYL